MLYVCFFCFLTHHDYRRIIVLCLIPLHVDIIYLLCPTNCIITLYPPNENVIQRCTHTPKYSKTAERLVLSYTYICYSYYLLSKHNNKHKEDNRSDISVLCTHDYYVHIVAAIFERKPNEWKICWHTSSFSLLFSFFINTCHSENLCTTTEDFIPLRDLWSCTCFSFRKPCSKTTTLMTTSMKKKEEKIISKLAITISSIIIILIGFFPSDTKNVYALRRTQFRTWASVRTVMLSTICSHLLLLLLLLLSNDNILTMITISNTTTELHTTIICSWVWDFSFRFFFPFTEQHN